MVIRILLRRQDYSLLKKMIQENMINLLEEDLRYILQCMDKILEHKDLKKEKENEFEDLKIYIQDKINNKK